jgi:hypothetical protein
VKRLVPIILFSLVLSACGTSVATSPTPAAVTLYAKDQLSLAGDTIGRGDGNGSYFVRGTVKNIGDYQLRSVKLMVTVFDLSGNIINTNGGYVDSAKIEPGATSTFKIYVDDPYQHGVRHTVVIDDAQFVK